jgi:hypothetical protein
VRASGINKADAARVGSEGAWRRASVGGVRDSGKSLVEGLFQSAGFGVEGCAGLGVTCYVLIGHRERGCDIYHGA